MVLHGSNVWQLFCLSAEITGLVSPIKRIGKYMYMHIHCNL